MKLNFTGGPLDGQVMYSKSIGDEIVWTLGADHWRYHYVFNGSREPFTQESTLTFKCVTPEPEDDFS